MSIDNKCHNCVFSFWGDFSSKTMNVRGDGKCSFDDSELIMSKLRCTFSIIYMWWNIRFILLIGRDFSYNIFIISFMQFFPVTVTFSLKLFIHPIKITEWKLSTGKMEKGKDDGENSVAFDENHISLPFNVKKISPFLLTRFIVHRCKLLQIKKIIQKAYIILN